MSARRWRGPLRDGPALADVGLRLSLGDDGKPTHRVRRPAARALREPDRRRERSLHAAHGAWLFNQVQGRVHQGLRLSQRQRVAAHVQGGRVPGTQRLSRINYIR